MNRSKSRPALLLTATLFLSACATGSSDLVACPFPAWPVAGPAVAAELERLPAAEFPATWEWMDRLDTLRLQLQVR